MEKQIATPDPALVPDPYLRQILQALRLNQITLYRALQAAGTTTAGTSTATTKAAKLPIRSAGNTGITAQQVNITLPPDSTAGNTASIATLANANKAAIIQLATEYNQLQADVVKLAETLRNMQGQQAEIINRLNQGNTSV